MTVGGHWDLMEQLKFITLITPTKGGRLGAAQVRMKMGMLSRRWLVDAFSKLSKYTVPRKVVNLAAGRLDEPYPPTLQFESWMKRLEFLHFARWTMVGRLPKEGRGSPGLNFFVTNFDGEGASYIAGFVDAFGVGGMSFQWGGTPGWPGRAATTQGLIGFAMRHVHPNQHEFKAYPTFTTSDVRRALRVEREVRSFHTESRWLDPERWNTEFGGLLRRIEPCLGRTAGISDPSLTRDLMVLPAAGHSWGFLMIAPMSHETAVDVSARLMNLRDLPGADGESPFRTVAGTHLSRLFIVDQLFNEVKQRWEPTEHAYLVYSAEFQTPLTEEVKALVADPDALDRAVAGDDFHTAVRAHLFAVHTGLDGVSPGLAGRIWEGCDDFPADASDPHLFVDYFLGSRPRGGRWGRVWEPSMSYVDYPNVTPAAAIRAVDRHRCFDDYLLVHASTTDPAERKEAFESAMDQFERLHA